MPSRTAEGYCATCLIGNNIARTTNLIAGVGPDASEMTVIDNVDFVAGPSTTPESLAADLGELTAPTTFSDLIRLGLSDADIQSMKQAGSCALAMLGDAAVKENCSGLVDGVCPVSCAEMVLASFLDAYEIHVLNK